MRAVVLALALAVSASAFTPTRVGRIARKSIVVNGVSHRSLTLL